VSFYQAGGDEEPQTEPGRAARMYEAVEDVLGQLGRNTGAAIGHEESDLRVFGLEADADLAAGRAELDGIRK
jgi:hypothetical protein